MTIDEVREKFPLELDAVKYFIQVRWGGKPQCTYCGSKRVSKQLKDNRFKCYECHMTTSVTVGTPLQGTNVKLRTWLLAFSIISTSENKITAGYLAKELLIPYSTAWRIYTKVRDMLSWEDKEGSLIAVVTSIGKLRKVLHKQQPIIERCIRIKSKRKPILQMYNPVASSKFSKIMKYIAKANDIFFLIHGLDADMIASFWGMVERQIRDRYSSIYLPNLKKYILQAVFEIHPLKDATVFEMLLNNSMKEIPRTRKVRNTGDYV